MTDRKLEELLAAIARGEMAPGDALQSLRHFTGENLVQFIGEFQGRERRFGKTGEQVRVT